VIKGITHAPLEEIIRGILPYVLLMLVGLIVVLLLPQTATWLPYVAGFGR
jgi:C4-dicarboxylate transporter DctM subunit